MLINGNVITALIEGIKFHELEITKLVAIPTACYWIIFGFIFILFSSQKFRHARNIPDYFKVKPRAEGKEVFWWPGAGDTR